MVILEKPKLLKWREYTFHILNNVYEPAEDTFLLAKFVKKFSTNKNVLEIGAGSGFLSKTAIQNKAKSVTATDIQKIKLTNKKIKFIQSDLFKKIPKQKFDLIIFNPPYLPEDKLEDEKEVKKINDTLKDVKISAANEKEKEK